MGRFFDDDKLEHPVVRKETAIKEMATGKRSEMRMIAEPMRRSQFRIFPRLYADAGYFLWARSICSYLRRCSGLSICIMRLLPSARTLS